MPRRPPRPQADPILFKPPRIESLRKLLSHLPEAEIDAAEARLWRYIKTVRAECMRQVREEMGRERRARDSTDRPEDSRID